VSRWLGPAAFLAAPSLRALVALLALACGAGEGDDWVARVDASEVSLAELQQAAAPRLEGVQEAQRESIWAEELERLVARRLVLNRAQELGVEVGEDEVDGRIQLVHGTEFEVPDEHYREEVRVQMTLERAAMLDLARAAQTPETAVLEYFERNRDRYRQPARITIRQIVVEDRAKAEHLRAELDGGSDFETLARAHSLAPEAALGGLLPPFARGEMPEAFDPAFDLRAGARSPVVESPYGFHIFLLVERLPEREPVLGEVREEILVALQSDRLDELRRGWLRELRRGANIELNERLLETLQ